MPKILVTGGAGFIGSALVKRLQRISHEVFVLDNLSFGRRDFVSVPDEHFFQEDLLNAGAITSIVKAIDPDWVLHLAAIHFIPYCNQHPFEASNINIQGTFHLLEALQHTSVQKVMFASTAAVYPAVMNPLKESHATAPLDIYGLSKWVGEQLMHRFYLETAIPTVVCRFFNAIGPNETNPHLFPAILTQIKAGKRTIRLGNLTPKRDYIHVNDMAEAVYQLMITTDNHYDIFNLGSGHAYSVLEIVQAFEEVLGEKITIETDETKVRKVERMHLVADIAKLQSHIDWSPKFNIHQAIRDLLN